MQGKAMKSVSRDSGVYHDCVVRTHIRARKVPRSCQFECLASLSPPRLVTDQWVDDMVYDT